MRSYINNQLESLNFNSYEKIVFIAKSIGCVEAGLVTEKYIVPFLENSSVEFQQIFLTPVAEVLPFYNTNCHIIIGTKDKAYSLFQEQCATHHIPLFTIEGGDHSLEITGKPLESINALKKVMEYLYK